MFYMKAAESQVNRKIDRIDEFTSNLVSDSLFSKETSTTGTAKYYWNFKVPLADIDERRASGFWKEEKVGIDYFATVIYIGLNVNHAELEETYLYS